MLRLTAVLVAGLYATMVIWGEPYDSDVAVTRAEAQPAALPAITADASSSRATSPKGDDLADIGAAEAVEIALAAGSEPAPQQSAPDVQNAEPATAAELWYVTGSRVNLRAGPSSSSAIVGGVGLGDRAEVLSDPSASWTQIRTESGTEAWIFSRFLSETPA